MKKRDGGEKQEGWMRGRNGKERWGREVEKRDGKEDREEKRIKGLK